MTSGDDKGADTAASPLVGDDDAHCGMETRYMAVASSESLPGGLPRFACEAASWKRVGETMGSHL